jgi:hypothetical protein
MSCNVDIHAILEILIMAYGFDQHELQKKPVTTDQNALTVAKWVVAAPSRKFSVTLQKLQERNLVPSNQFDLDNSRPRVQAFLTSAMLRLRQNSCMEFRILVPPQEKFIDSIALVATNLAEMGQKEKSKKEKFTVKTTLVFEDAESKGNLRRTRFREILFSGFEDVLIRVTTPEELTCMHANSVAASAEHTRSRSRQ